LAVDRFQLLYDSGVGKNYLSQNPNLTPEQIDLLYYTKPQEGGHFRTLLGQHSKLTDTQFMRFFNSSLGGNKDYLARNSNLTTEQIDLLYHAEGVDKNYLAQYPKLTEEQFLRLFNDGDVNKDYLAQNSNLTPEQIDILYKTKGVDKDLLAEYPKLTDEQFTRFFNDTYVNKFFLARNPNLTPEQIDILYKTKGVDKDLLAKFPKLTDEQFTRLFNTSDMDNTYLAANTNLTPEQIDLLYKTGEIYVQEYLAKYSKLTEEQFLRFFNDKRLNKFGDYDFSQIASLAQNPSINPPANQQFASGVFNWRW